MPYATVLALSKRNSNAAEIIIFLHRLTQVLIEYFKELEEESIRDNFVIIYELMDEMMDFGFPQTTESKILQECVKGMLRLCCVRTYAAPDTSPKSHTSWRYKRGHRWLSRMLSHGERKASGIGRTKYS
jgi:AP-1 complex subunit mu